MQGTPYVVGGWVRGDEHYARQSLIDHLLNSQDTAIWVVGTRRMGKTSLLRQIEHLSSQPDSPYLPLYWDLQGNSSPEELALDLAWILEDNVQSLQLSEDDLDRVIQSGDASSILRRLSRLVGRTDRQLLLLVDEAEVLLDIAEAHPVWLARLRKAMQEGHLRTIMTSTRLLSQLTDRSLEWATSPFLFGFHMVILWPLKWEGAAALVRRLQGQEPVEVDDDVLEQILQYTHYHPYLIQHLCAKLYTVGEDGVGYLRPVHDSDLTVNAMLADYFKLDYQRLTDLEQRILLYVARHQAASSTELRAMLGQQHASRLPTLLQSLIELGHLRQIEVGWAIGSEFMCRWLLMEMGDLERQLEAATVEMTHLNESNVDEIALRLGVSSERLRALTDIQIGTAGEFFNVVRSFFYEIRHLVEQDEGYRLLVSTGDDGKPTLRSEDEIQIALKHWLRPMCRALNVDMDRESMTGRGLLDFKFSLGYDFRCLVEVKLYHSAKLEDGVALQLPIYLMADKVSYGIYVPVFLETDDHSEQVQKLRELAAARAESHGLVLDVVDIRAARPRSASKAAMIDEMARYLPATLPVDATLHLRHSEQAETSQPPGIETQALASEHDANAGEPNQDPSTPPESKKDGSDKESSKSKRNRK